MEITWNGSIPDDDEEYEVYKNVELIDNIKSYISTDQDIELKDEYVWRQKNTRESEALYIYFHLYLVCLWSC